MTNSLGTKRTNWIAENGLLLIIAGLGLFLRVWQLGRHWFWVDEVAVAQAAFQPTLIDAIKIRSGHNVMVMPLDYVVAWLFARISHTEWVLRLPEALWGSLTLLAGYHLCLLVSGKKRLALFAMLMMALSPILVLYSQELRFYAPLTFFYTLSIYLGVKAVQQPNNRNWGLFTLATLIGLYFHFYMIFVLGIFFLWLLATHQKGQWQRLHQYFAGSATILSIMFFIGLAIFGSSYPEEKYPLFMAESFSSFLLTGLGWKLSFPASPVSWILGMLFMVFALLGIFISLKKNLLSFSSILAYSVLIQVAIVLTLNLVNNYFVHSRQIIMMVPIMLYFSAHGMDWVLEQIDSRQRRKYTSLQSIQLSIIFSLTLCLTAVPALMDLYNTNKGSAKDILVLLAENRQSQEPIYIGSGSWIVFDYYVNNNYKNSGLAENMVLLDYNSEDITKSLSPAWVITIYEIEETKKEALRSANFSPYYLPSYNTIYPQILWHRK